MIRLHVEPQQPPMYWPDFCLRQHRNQQPFAVALDGYVSGAPRFDPTGPYVSFNHHEDVDRLATRATCAQVLMAIRQGFFHAFHDKDGSRAEVYVNDCDEDVCTAWTLLKHHYMVESTMNPAFNRLVAMEDALDSTAGAYPFPPDLPALRELAWVFEPYRQFRLSGQLDKKDAKAYEAVITDVELRILQHVAGRGKEVPLDTRFERIGGGPGWTMVRELGAQARTGMLADGIRVFVSVRERPTGGYTYVIGKLSSFIPVWLSDLAFTLNSVEGLTGDDQWGGSDMIIGSPRVAGSTLTPEELAGHVNEYFSTHPFS